VPSMVIVNTVPFGAWRAGTVFRSITLSPAHHLVFMTRF